MPHPGVSVPRGKTLRGDRWSDDLELEIPVRLERRAPSDRATGRVRSPRPDVATHFSEPLRREAIAREPVVSLPEVPYLDLAPTADRAERSPSTGAAAGVPGRRTVTIQGRPSDRYRPGLDSRRPQRLPHHRAGFQPDRVAMWAVFLGLVLLLVAATSSHAAVLSVHALARLAGH